MKSRKPVKLYKRHTTNGKSFVFYIDCEDKYSPLAIWLDHKGCGYIDTMGPNVWETSWLDLLVTTGIPEAKIHEALGRGLSTPECEELFWPKEK